MALVCTFYGGGTMPEFTTVSVKEAQMRTIPGRQGAFMNEYANYIQQLPTGQAGRLRIEEQEKHATVRHRLGVAAKALGINLIIKRSGNDLYFWQEDTEEEQSRSKRRYTRRGRAGDFLPGQSFGAPQDVRDPEENGYTVTEEDSPEVGETEPVVSDAMRRVDPE
jgi:hypothetical protein